MGGCGRLAERTSPPASPGNPYRRALVATARSLDEDRVIGVRVLSWLDVEIGQRGDQLARQRHDGHRPYLPTQAITDRYENTY